MDVIKGTYIKVIPDIFTKGALVRFCHDMKINMVNPDDLHSTLIACPKIDLTETITKNELYFGSNFEFDIWKDMINRDILVLKFQSIRLSLRHQELCSEYKFTHPFPDFIPHITIAINPNITNLEYLSELLYEYILHIRLINETQHTYKGY